MKLLDSLHLAAVTNTALTITARQANVLADFIVWSKRQLDAINDNDDDPDGGNALYTALDNA